jgi:hypothetical protein
MAMRSAMALGAGADRPRRGRYATTLQLIDPDRLSDPFEAQDTIGLRKGSMGSARRSLTPIGRHPGDWYAPRRP